MSESAKPVKPTPEEIEAAHDAEWERLFVAASGRLEMEARREWAGKVADAYKRALAKPR
jgi:hypothetical protein